MKFLRVLAATNENPVTARDRQRLRSPDIERATLLSRDLHLPTAFALDQDSIHENLREAHLLPYIKVRIPNKASVIRLPGRLLPPPTPNPKV